MIKFTAQEQKQLDKLKKGLNRNTRLDHAASIAAYIKKYASSGKMVKGTWRRWDSRTNKWYNSKDVIAYLNKQEYGTATPKEDLKYLQALKLQSIREAGTQYKDPTRVNLSRKLVIDETNPYGTVYEKEQAARMNKDRAKLTQLRKKSSYVERDFGSDYAEKEKALFIAAGDEAQIPGSNANEALKIENKNTKGKVQAPMLVAGDPTDTRKSKGPASSTVQATLKSDVFTLDKDGKMLGVMTRSQRRNWDAANQSLMIERQKDLKIADRSYYNRGELLRIGSG